MFLEYIVPGAIAAIMVWFAWESSIMVDEKKKAEYNARSK